MVRNTPEPPRGATPQRAGLPNVNVLTPGAGRLSRGCLVHCGTLGSTLGLPYQTPEHTHCDNQKREA